MQPEVGILITCHIVSLIAVQNLANSDTSELLRRYSAGDGSIAPVMLLIVI